MPPLVAAVIYTCGILFLLSLDPDLRGRINAPFLVPLFWFLINGSRPVTAWIQKNAISAQQMEGNPVDRVVILTIQIAGFAILYQRRVTIEKILRANPFLTLFIFYALLSTVWSDYPLVAFKRWVRVLGDITMVLIVLSEPNRQRAIKRTFITAGFILIPCSVLLDKYFPALSRYYDPFSGGQFFSGVGEDKNMLGMTCLIFGLAILWQLLLAYKAAKSRTRTRRLIAYGTTLAMVIYLLHTANSMTSLSCFVMGAIVLAVTILIKKMRKPGLMHLMVAGIIGATFAVLFLHVNEKSLLHSLGRNSTLTGRTEIWSAVLHFSANPLIGTGFESFWLGPRMLKVWAYNPFAYGVNEAHNGYIEMYLNLGWIGVGILMGLIVTGYKHVMKAFWPDPELGAMRLSFLVVAVIYGFTEVAFRENCSVWLAFLLAIIAVPLPLSKTGSRSGQRLQSFQWGYSEEPLGEGVTESEYALADR
jgi:exopolysaccharide production protein ExoQ